VLRRFNFNESSGGRLFDIGGLINRLRRGQLDPRVANAMGYLASVLLKALDQRLEERLAHLEAVISGKGETESQGFEFRPAKESKHEESSTARQGD
jgi:hypothetical protein